MQVTRDELDQIRGFVESLNAQECAVLVEGRRDAAALRSIGYAGDLLVFHSYGGPVRFAEVAASHDRIIMLLDGDRRGRLMTARIVTLLQRKTRLDLVFRKRLVRATRGRIKFIEELSRYSRHGHMPL